VTTTVPLQSGGSTKTVNTYNGSGNISTVSRLNSCSGCSGDQTTRYEYDELNRLVTTTQGYGSFNYKQVNIYDQNGNVVETRQGKITNVTNWSDPAQVVTSTTNYDDLSRPITSTTYAWNPLTSVNTPLATVYAYNNAQNLNTVVDPYGITAKSQSDPGGRAISTTIMPGPNTNGAQTQFSFNLYEARGLISRTVDPAGNWADTAYDKLGRATTTTSYTGVGGTGTALTSSTYYTDTAKPQFTSIGPAPDYVRQDSFMDEAGRVLTSTVYTGTAVTYPTVPAGALNTTYTYDGQSNRLTMTDPTGYITRFGYENSGWLKLVTQTVTPLGASQPVTLTTAYNYDLLGNRLSTLDALSHSSSTVYDILNRVVTETDALNNPWQMAYDGLGRMTSRSDVLNQTSLYTYDNASRMVQLASAGNITTTYSYSAGGQPLTMVDKLGAGAPITTSYDYDGLNRIITTTSPQGLVKYGYDILGRRNSLAFGPTLAKLVTSTYGYDSLSRPISMSNGLTTPPNQLVSYNYTGERLTSLSYPNGVTATYSYDGASRLTGINQTKGVSTTIFSVNYTLDKLGNRTGLNENLNGQARTLGYTYDELSRLVKEVTQVGGSQPVTGTYTYDNVGNRSQLVSYAPPNTKGGANPTLLTTTYAYDQADRLNTRIVLAGSSQPVTTTYSYNGNGSLIGESAPGSELVTYTYDVRNRLSNWQKGKGGAVLSTANFKYDGRDTRLSMDYTVITQTQTTNYLQDTGSGLPVVLMEVNPTTGGANSFLYPLGSTSPIFEEEQTGTEMWYHSDGLGSVRALTGSSGNILNTYAYNAFGQKTGGTYNSKLETDHQFAGEQLDPTGLYYNRARYYSPGLGRFIGRDSEFGDTLNPLSLNRYSYAWNNPPNRTDPSGNEPKVYDSIPKMKELESTYGVQFYSNYRTRIAVVKGGKKMSVTEKFSESCTNAVSSGCTWFDLNDEQLKDALEQTERALKLYNYAFGGDSSSFTNFKKHMGRIILKYIPDTDPDSKANDGVSDVWGDTINIKQGNSGSRFAKDKLLNPKSINDWRNGLTHEFAHVWWNHDKLQVSYLKAILGGLDVDILGDNICFLLSFAGINIANTGPEEPPTSYAHGSSYEDFADSVRCALRTVGNVEECGPVGPKRLNFIESHGMINIKKIYYPGITPGER